MQTTQFLIKDAAKKIEVESHVLRYWEEELKLDIKRNEQGHRYYTDENVQQFLYIKKLKKEGLQLRAIRKMLEGDNQECSQEGKIEPNIEYNNARNQLNFDRARNRAEDNFESIRKPEFSIITRQGSMTKKEMFPDVELGEDKQDKAMRLQQLLKHMMSEALKEENVKMCNEIKESVVKELDYQFRMQDERIDEREKERVLREEQHYKKIDEVLRLRTKKEKRKKHSSF
ncbi:MAG TPA: helix-turn-helix domain-containing protein [Lachnospiraceae bacterium]|nr:helix-turn-helix domain-containing protein [Lachnospiraceae bacterium]